MTLEIIPGIDHAYAQAADFAESHKNYQTGNFVDNPAAKERVVAWLKEDAGKTAQAP